MKHKGPTTATVQGPVGKLMATVEGEGGVPVLFVHDNAADRTHWKEVQHGLASHSVAFDLRGLGESGGAHGPFGVEAGVEDVAAVADALLPGRFVLVGHGFGAAVAGAFASYYPERVCGLLYVEPFADRRGVPAAERDAHLAQFSPEHYGPFHEHWLAQLLTGAREATRTAVMRSLRTSRREAVEGNEASLYAFDPGDAFAQYSGPTHALVSRTGPDTLVGQHPELTRTVAPHTSHWLQLDSPQWFHTELVHFLPRCKAPHAEKAGAA
jgi:pimeloyl-ACP methyl ester carboxylesterase